MDRGDLTNSQWARLEPLLPHGIKPGRPPVWARRQLIDGIRWRTRTGAVAPAGDAHLTLCHTKASVRPRAVTAPDPG
ncbi:transposase [Streptomyces sp. NBC_00234]|uniref:transposase n=1 Tax=Streptomyces sp. NBC_00234 TaxID=2903638 RepID=UPI003FA75D1C